MLAWYHSLYSVCISIDSFGQIIASTLNDLSIYACVSLNSHMHEQYVAMYFYYIKLKSRLFVCLSVCLSVRLHFWRNDNSAVCALIKARLAQNESCVFEEHNVYFYKPTEPTVHRQECVKDEGVSSHYPIKHVAAG